MLQDHRFPVGQHYEDESGAQVFSMKFAGWYFLPFQKSNLIKDGKTSGI